MKIKILLLSLVLLCGCARHEPINDAVSALDSQIQATEQAAFALHESLPKTCLTKDIEEQFKALFADIAVTRSQLTSVYSTVRGEISLYKARENLHFLMIFVLAIGCFALLWNKFRS